MFYKFNTGDKRFAFSETGGEDWSPISTQDHAALFAAQSLGARIQPDAQGRPAAVQPAPATPEQIKAVMVKAVQHYMDAAAKARGYDSLLSAVSYADEPAAPAFQADGLAFRAWRSKVWVKCYEVLASVQGGSMAPPSVDGLIALLPKLVMAGVPN